MDLSNKAICRRGKRPGRSASDVAILEIFKSRMGQRSGSEPFRLELGDTGQPV